MNQIRLTTEDVAALCRAMASLLQAGISPGDGLTLLAQEEAQPAWRELLSAMAVSCDEGRPLPQVFREAGCFPGYVCALLTVGDRVGQSAGVLDALADYYDNRARMNRQLKAALTYPAMLLAVLVGVVVALLVWVLPVFDDVYAQLGSGLAGFAGGLLAFGRVLRGILPWICLALAALLLAAAIPPVRKRGMLILSARFGDRGALAKVNSARFVQALSLGLSSGMTDQEGAELACELAFGEAGFDHRSRRCLELLDEGMDLPQALQQTGMITAGDCRLLSLARRSGQGEQALAILARKLREQGEEALEQTVGKIEPAIVAVACGLIGMVLLTVMLPLVQIMNAIG